MPVKRIYYVEGFGTVAIADTMSREDFLVASSDPIKDRKEEVEIKYVSKGLLISSLVGVGLEVSITRLPRSN
eukprot:scaffold2466_cov333-Pavlova_lutheri.AAC.3